MADDLAFRRGGKVPPLVLAFAVVATIALALRCPLASALYDEGPSSLSPSLGVTLAVVARVFRRRKRLSLRLARDAWTENALVS